MLFPRFTLEDWFAQYKPGCSTNMGSSDIEPVAVADLAPPGGSLDVVLRDVDLGYGGALGSPALREHIAATYHGVDRDMVHCFVGATEAVLCAYAALLSPGDHVVVVTPTYQLLVDLPLACGATVTPVPLERDGNRWSLSTAAVGDAVRDTTRAIVVNTPNNPTGWVADVVQLRELAGLAGAVGAVLVGDEVYRGLGISVPSVAELPDPGLAIGSLSKTYGTAGLRVGWVVARDDDVRDRMRTARYWSSLSSSPVTDALAVCTLQQGPALQSRAADIVAANTALVERFVGGRDDIAWAPPRGGTTAYVELLAADAAVVARRLAVEHAVFTVPSVALPAPGQHLRIALGRTGLAHGLQLLATTLGP